MVDNAKHADVVVHDTYNTVEQLVARSGYDAKQARGMSGFVHSLPHEAGKVFDMIKPRLAVGFHFFNDFDTAPEMASEIRKYYSGPLALADDLMVFNVTPEQVAVRMTVAAQHVWPSRPDKGEAFQKAPRDTRLMLSEPLRAAQLFPK
jgi:ribonuclease Z